jgi:hypothetical protein
MVIEYDEGVADMSASLSPFVGYGQVAVVVVAAHDGIPGHPGIPSLVTLQAAESAVHGSLQGHKYVVWPGDVS